MRFANGNLVQGILDNVRKIFEWGYRPLWCSRVEVKLEGLLLPLIDELTREDRLGPDGSLTLPEVFIEVVIANLTILRKMATRATYLTSDAIISRERGAPGSWFGTDNKRNPGDINSALVFLEFVAQRAVFLEASSALAEALREADYPRV
jgi:hypothetical protein